MKAYLNNEKVRAILTLLAFFAIYADFLYLILNIPKTHSPVDLLSFYALGLLGPWLCFLCLYSLGIKYPSSINLGKLSSSFSIARHQGYIFFTKIYIAFLSLIVLFFSNYFSASLVFIASDILLLWILVYALFGSILYKPQANSLSLYVILAISASIIAQAYLAKPPSIPVGGILAYSFHGAMITLSLAFFLDTTWSSLPQTSLHRFLRYVHLGKPLLRMKEEVTVPWVGFRGWAVTEILSYEDGEVISNYSLSSLVHPALGFMGRTFVASCHKCASVPSLTHTCGLYAAFDLVGATLYVSSRPTNTHILGAVKAQGLAIEHPGDGFRSQRQTLLCILDRSTAKKEDKLSKAVAQSLRVPCLAKEEMLSFLREQGELATREAA